MLASVAVLPADRRPSAFRRFPPGCGRRTNAAARLPPRYPLPATAAAAASNKPPLPNPSLARAANKTAPPQPRRTLPAAAASGAAGPCRGVGSGRKAAAALTARRVSAVRRYPPGCGRGVAAPKPPASVGEGQGEAGAGKTTAVVCDGYAMARPCDLEVALLASALDHAEFNSNGEMQNEGGGDAGAREGVGGKPWVVTGLMAVPFLPWAQYGRRSQGLNV
ncbi:hypothetical protein C2845_PM09G03120 [Panicum miliaceum]|uniref:Uncharacterized protein n=1 Tax=Panicum miliaceum TaxID=4540 RepID=A0A3L6RX69_PANMI|nr:hypothetical protein C2845_PM09G03120 [Panicum miliaceum]